MTVKTFLHSDSRKDLWQKGVLPAPMVLVLFSTYIVQNELILPPLSSHTTLPAEPSPTQRVSPLLAEGRADHRGRWKMTGGI